MAEQTDKRAIGVFDSGVGGLSCVPAIKRALPHEQIIFFGDSARNPYGSRPEEEIIKFAIEDAELLIDKGCKLLSIACNTISGVASEALKKEYPDIPIVGIIDPAAEALAKDFAGKQIALIATDATVKSGVYQRLLKEYGYEREVPAKGCTIFVPYIERGETGPDFDRVIKDHLGSFIADAKADVLILGCTHFPFIAENIKRLYPDLMLFDPAEALAAKTKAVLKEKGLLSGKKTAEDIFLCSSKSEVFDKFVSDIKQTV